MESKWSGSGGAGGGGDVFGPVSSTDNAVARFDGTTGDTLQNSPVTIADNGDVAGVNDLDVTGDVSAANISLTGDITVDVGGAKEMILGQELFDIIGTGVDTWAGFTITGGGSTFTIGAGTGHIAKHITDQFYDVTWNALTGNNPLTADGVTYVYIDTDGSASLTTTYPTPSERRQKILLGRVVTVASTIVQTVSMASVAQDVPNAVQDLAYGIGVFNIEGNEFSANGANLKLNKSAGKLYSSGANFLTSSDNPNWVTTGSATAATFAYITQAAGSTGANTTDVVPGSYDNAGTVTAIPGGSNQATNQRIYLFPSGNIQIAYGQTIYSSLTAAIQGISTESWTTNPNIPGNGVLVGILTVTKGCTDLSVSTNARFFRASRFGEVSVGAAGGGTTNLQQAYNNSTSPEITTDSTRGALQIQRGSAADTDDVLTVENGSGTTQFSVKGNGNVDIGGNLVVTGDLTVNGTTTTLNTQTLDVEDANIRINKGGNDTSAEGAGLAVEGTGGVTRGTIQYDGALTSRFKLGASGSEDEVLTRTANQTVTGKTISGASNTITNVSLTTGVTGTLPIANGGTGQTAKTAAFDALSPQTTKGDLIGFDGSDAVRLGVGADGQVLTANSSTSTGLEWAPALTNPMTSVGDLIRGGASGAATRLAIGTTGQILEVDSGIPAWRTGLRGQTSGSAVASGTVGQAGFNEQTLGPTAASTSAAAFSIGSISLSAGVWIVFGYGVLLPGTALGNTYLAFDLNTSVAFRDGSTLTRLGLIGQAGNTSTSCLPLYVNSNGSTTVHAIGAYNYSSLGTSTMRAAITAIRIA